MQRQRATHQAASRGKAGDAPNQKRKSKEEGAEEQKLDESIDEEREGGIAQNGAEASRETAAKPDYRNKGGRSGN